MSVLLISTLSSLVIYCLAVSYYLRQSMLPGIGGGMAFSAVAFPLLTLIVLLALGLSVLISALVMREISTMQLTLRIFLIAGVFVGCFGITGVPPVFLPSNAFSYLFPGAILIVAVSAALLLRVQ